MSHTVKLHGQSSIPLLGTVYIDLTSYVRIGADQGMAVDVGEFLAPQFGDTPLAEGQPLLAVTANAKEKVYPLGLNDSTAAEVAQLQQALTWHTTQNGSLLLEEQQEGASASAWWGVLFARFEPETNPRRAAHGWRLGVLRVWTKPYADTATSRLVATAAASAGIVAVTGPIGSVAGDIGAQLDIRLRTGVATPVASAFLADGQAALVSVLPHASYRVFFGASQITGLAPSTAVVSLNSAPGGVVRTALDPNYTQDVPLFAVDLSPASYYLGRNRVFALARHGFWGMRAFGPAGALGPTAVASSFLSQALVDLGTVTIDESYQAATARLSVRGGVMGQSFWTPGYGVYTSGDVVAYPEIGGVIVVPEDKTALLVDSRLVGAGADSFDGATVPQQGLAGRVDSFGNAWATTPLASAGLYVGMANVPGIAGVYHPSMTGYQTMGNVLSVDPIEDMRIETDVLSLGGTAGIELLKYVATNSYIRAAYRMNASTLTNRLELTILSAGATVYATQVTATAAFAQFVLQNRGPVIQARIGGPNQGGTFELTASSPVAEKPGVPVLRMSATSTSGATALVYGALVSAIRVSSVPSTPVQGSQPFVFDGVNARVQRLTQASAWQEDVTARTRGQIPLGPVPTIPAVAAVALPMNGGNANNSLSVEVRVRERFTFIR